MYDRHDYLRITVYMQLEIPSAGLPIILSVQVTDAIGLIATKAAETGTLV
jgi:hypothetical protein